MIKFSALFNRNKSKIAFFAILFAVLLALASCSGGERVSEIKSVVYSTKSDMIEVSATLDSADVREFRGETVYLIEVPANNSVDDILTLIPAAQTKLGAEMKFSLPLREGARTRLYSGFVLAVFDRTNGYIALSDVHYLDNPEVLAQNKTSYPEYPTIKGLSIVSSSDATLLGVKHTVIRVPIEQYILGESAEGAHTYVFDGESHYYNGERVNELDYKIKNLTGAGIEVILEFTLDTPPEKLPFALSSIASKKPVSSETEHREGDHYAISVTGGDSYRHIAALFEFFSERYTRTDAKYGLAGSFIVGNGVNSLTDTGIDDARTLADAVYRYEKLLRIARTALTSRYKEGKVFVSLDNKWNVEEKAEEETAPIDPSHPVSQRDSFGGAEYLEALFERIALGGAYEVGVALMPNASDDSSAVWNDIGASESADSKYLTVKNLSLIRSVIGKESELVVYNYGISASDEKSMEASYAYAFMKAWEAGASAFIYNGHADFLTGNGETGLMKISEDGVSVIKREIYDVFRNIDVKGAPEPESARLRIGGEWSDIYAKYGEKSAKALVTEGDGSTVKNEKDKKLKKATSSMLFDFSEGKNFEFFPSDSAYYIEVGDELGARALKSGLAAKFKGENMGVRSSRIPFEKLDGAFQITAVLSADPGGGNTAKVTLALVQSGERGVIHTSSAILQASNRQTVYFDIRDAKLDEKYGDVLLYMWVESSTGRSPLYSGEEDDGQYLLIENISVEIRKQLGAFSIVLIIVIALALVVGVLYLMYRRSTGGPRRPRGPQRPVNPYGNTRAPQHMQRGPRPQGRPYPPQPGRRGNAPVQRPVTRQRMSQNTSANMNRRG